MLNPESSSPRSFLHISWQKYMNSHTNWYLISLFSEDTRQFTFNVGRSETWRNLSFGKPLHCKKITCKFIEVVFLLMKFSIFFFIISEVYKYFVTIRHLSAHVSPKHSYNFLMTTLLTNKIYFKVWVLSTLFLSFDEYAYLFIEWG